MARKESALNRGMVVVAHADDAEWGCSGTVAKFCAEGWEMVYVLCTDGSKGIDDPEISADELIRIRMEEQTNAGKVLGLHDVVFLGYEDAMLQPSLDLRRDIAKQIRRYRPNLIICQNPVRDLVGRGYLGHPDHFAAGEATLAAVYPTARDRLTFPELLAEGLEPHKVPELWIMDRQNADQYVDVTDYIETAVNALRAHASQVDREDADRYLKGWRSEIGAEVGFQYAEAFKRFELG